MPAMMKSMGQSSLETLTDACENPATGEKQHGNQDISKVYHGNVTSTPRIPRGAHPFGEPAQVFAPKLATSVSSPPRRSENAASEGFPLCASCRGTDKCGLQSPSDVLPAKLRIWRSRNSTGPAGFVRGSV